MRLLLLLSFLACADRPAGWETAERIPTLSQSPCDGSPYDDDVMEGAQGFAEEGGLRLVYDPVRFRCAQDVEGWYMLDGDHVDVLLQPIDMNPAVVAACDCLYRVEARIPESGLNTATAWRRWDRLNDDPQPVKVGDVQVSR